jgi:hypothetical protein
MAGELQAAQLRLRRNSAAIDFLKRVLSFVLLCVLSGEKVKCEACTQDPITHTMRQVGSIETGYVLHFCSVRNGALLLLRQVGWDARGRPVMYSSFKQVGSRNACARSL